MKILLHICCANCAITPVEVLRAEGHQLTGYFFNPNIHPYQEFRRRRDTARQYAAGADLDMIWEDDYLLEEFLAQVASQPAHRCAYCYTSRLEKTAALAVEKGFDAFTTSLLYSRRQQHELIRLQGEAAAARHGIAFFYRDFRLGWQRGIDQSKALGLYRQNYCGCIYSEMERFAPRKMSR